ncbi:SEC-C metal-binding domain-containing protein [Klebsiella pneumoniae]
MGRNDPCPCGSGKKSRKNAAASNAGAALANITDFPRDAFITT